MTTKGVSPAKRALLNALESSGRQDRAYGKSLNDGWREIAELCGYDPHKKTMEYTTYADGWNKGVLK